MTDGGMGVTEAYAQISVILSLVSLVLSLGYLFRVARSYRHFHDERAAVSLGKAVGLVVVAFGLTVSSMGLITDQAVLSTAGLSLARGALLVTLASLVLARVRPRDEEEE
jgi:hypothetical protein